MNHFEAARYNDAQRGVRWRATELPDRWCAILGSQDTGQGLDHLPRLLEKTAVQGRELAYLFAQEVCLFQMLHGLVADGKLGPATLQAMKNEQPPAAQIPLVGKGLWIWNEDQLPKNHVALAKEAGIGHVLIKVADHGSVFPPGLPDTTALERLQKLFDGYRNAGILAHPWVYAGCYEDDNERGAKLLRQADLHVKLAHRFGAALLVVNAEKGFKRYYVDSHNNRHEFPHHREHAARYIERLRGAGCQLALSSYFYVEGHGNFAWEELGAGVDVLMPQAYWSVKARSQNDPHRAIFSAAESWRDRLGVTALGKPILPSGGLYQTKKEGDWPDDWHRPSAIREFISTLVEHRLPGATFWWYTAPTNKDSGSSRVTTDRWQALAAAHADFVAP